VRKKAPALAMLCLLSLLLRAQDPAERDAGSKILALESVWNQAEENGNVAALDLIFDNSMIYIGEDGALLTKAQFLNQVAKEAGTDLQRSASTSMATRRWWWEVTT
jgi:hypothetical protein